MNEFLPKDYIIPTDSKYMKMEKGANKFRIMSSAIMGYEWWGEENGKRKPFRVKTFQEAVNQGVEPIKHFWACVVWNYATQRIQVLQITQKSIMNGIKSYTEDESWGSPFEYDLSIKKDGEGMDTEYQVMAIPPKKVSQEIKKEFDNTFVDLTALFKNEDPFDQTASLETALEVK